MHAHCNADTKARSICRTHKEQRYQVWFIMVSLGFSRLKQGPCSGDVCPIARSRAPYYASLDGDREAMHQRVSGLPGRDKTISWAHLFGQSIAHRSPGPHTLCCFLLFPLSQLCCCLSVFSHKPADITQRPGGGSQTHMHRASLTATLFIRLGLSVSLVLPGISAIARIMFP